MISSAWLRRGIPLRSLRSTTGVERASAPCTVLESQTWGLHGSDSLGLNTSTRLRQGRGFPLILSDTHTNAHLSSVRFSHRTRVFCPKGCVRQCPGFAESGSRVPHVGTRFRLKQQRPGRDRALPALLSTTSGSGKHGSPSIRGGSKHHLRFSALGTRKTVPPLGRGEGDAPRQHRALRRGRPGTLPRGCKGAAPKPLPPLGGPGRSRAGPALAVPPGGSAAQPSDRPQPHRQLCPAPEPAGSAPRAAGGQGQGAGAGSRAGITGRRRCEAGSGAGSAEQRGEPGRGAPGGSERGARN